MQRSRPGFLLCLTWISFIVGAGGCLTADPDVCFRHTDCASGKLCTQGHCRVDTSGSTPDDSDASADGANGDGNQQVEAGAEADASDATDVSDALEEADASDVTDASDEPTDGSTSSDGAFDVEAGEVEADQGDD